MEYVKNAKKVRINSYFFNTPPISTSLLEQFSRRILIFSSFLASSTIVSPILSSLTLNVLKPL